MGSSLCSSSGDGLERRAADDPQEEIEGVQMKKLYHFLIIDGISASYVFWWEGKTVRKKWLTTETLCTLLLGLDEVKGIFGIFKKLTIYHVLTNGICLTIVLFWHKNQSGVVF
jgi:hypothetical protein